MIALTGEIRHIFLTPEGQDTKTGQSYGGKYMVQIEGESTLKNGQKRFEIVTLKTDNPEPFRKLQGKTALVPVGCFAPARNQIQYFITGLPRAINGGQ